MLAALGAVTTHRGQGSFGVRLPLWEGKGGWYLRSPNQTPDLSC
jgi:hypothetical protein